MLMLKSQKETRYISQTKKTKKKKKKKKKKKRWNA